MADDPLFSCRPQMKKSAGHRSFSRGWLKIILNEAKTLVEKGFSKQNAFHASVLHICQRYKVGDSRYTSQFTPALESQSSLISPSCQSG